MPRQDKATTAIRYAGETIHFNTRAVKDDLDLLALLLEQEMRRRDFPSDRLLNAKEIVERLKKYNQEIDHELLRNGFVVSR